MAPKLVKNRCPRCDGKAALLVMHDEFGDGLKCMVCGWHGFIDDSGHPAVLDPTPPVAPQRRRGNNPVVADPPEVMNIESGQDTGAHTDPPFH